MNNEGLMGFIGFIVFCLCMVVSSFFLKLIHDEDMKKHYTIQIDDRVFIDIWALRISKHRRLVAFNDREHDKIVERYIYFDELHIMKVEDKTK